MVTHAVIGVLLEEFENGALSSRRILLEVNALRVNGHTSVNSHVVIFMIDENMKWVEFMSFTPSTEDNTIRNIHMTEEMLSFDMLLWSDQDRPLRVTAHRVR